MKRIVNYLMVFFLTLSLTFSCLPVICFAAVYEGIQISSQEIRSDSELIKINMKYPAVSGPVNQSIKNQLNSRFKNQALDFKNNLEKQAGEDYDNAKKQGYTFRSYEAFENYKVTFTKNNILSIPVTFYSYTGGAHGGSFISPNNLDLTTGKPLLLKDLFNQGTDYKNIILSEITRQIQSNPGDYFPDAIDTVKKLDDSQNYYLINDGIVIYYGEYQIAPYAAGIREFKIPFSTFRDGVKETLLK